MSIPLRRPSRGVVQLDHENRIQTLERRIPVDYPVLYGQLLDRLTNVGPSSSDEWPFTFPDDCVGDPVECEDEFVTNGNYILFPTGYSGPFHVYLNAYLAGGAGNVDDAYVATTPGDDTPSKVISVSPAVEVWRDNAPYGSTSTWAYLSNGETMKGQAGINDDRAWWAHYIHPGHGIFDRDRERYALRVFFNVGATAGPVTVDGIVTVELMPPQNNVAGFAG